MKQSETKNRNHRKHRISHGILRTPGVRQSRTGRTARPAGIVLTAVLAVSMFWTFTLTAFADAETAYVSLGADLTADGRATVLKFLDLTEEDLKTMDVQTITNADERKALGEYLPESVIGTRALSSVKVVPKDTATGIHVETHNITYCTEGMYQNALITAGVENADITVAGPTPISGTAALVGAMKAYENIDGKNLSEKNQDAAVDELVTTGELGSRIGSEDAENLMALAKQKISTDNLKSDADITKAINDAAGELGISLTSDEKNMILELLKKIADLNLDQEALKQQASDLYDRLSSLGVDMSSFDKQGFVDKMSSLFQKVLHAIKGLFGKQDA